MSRTEWTISRQARPEAAGTYWVTLEWPERETVYSDDGMRAESRNTGRMCRAVTQRCYDRPGEYAGWQMDGEDSKDYHWSERGGSSPHERVIAWMGPIEPPEMFRGELQDGYEYVWEKT